MPLTNMTKLSDAGGGYSYVPSAYLSRNKRETDGSE